MGRIVYETKALKNPEHCKVCFVLRSYLGKFPVTYIGSFSNGICMSGLLAVSINIAILGMDVDMEVINK